jgi:LysR family nitrogen assimilation transcriptional regulator
MAEAEQPSWKRHLGILHELGPLRHLTARRLATEELFLVGPAGAYGDLGGMPDVPLADLGDLPMMLPRLPLGLRHVIEDEMARAGVALKLRLEIDAMAHVGPLVAAGHGYSIMPLPVVSEALAAGRVSIARIGGGAIRRTLCLVRNSSQVVTHASIRCEDLTVKVLSRLIEKGAWLAEPDPGLR